MAVIVSVNAANLVRTVVDIMNGFNAAGGRVPLVEPGRVARAVVGEGERVAARRAGRSVPIGAGIPSPP